MSKQLQRTWKRPWLNSYFNLEGPRKTKAQSSFNAICCRRLLKKVYVIEVDLYVNLQRDYNDKGKVFSLRILSFHGDWMQLIILMQSAV
jgi:hypothetical protein